MKALKLVMILLISTISLNSYSQNSSDLLTAKKINEAIARGNQYIELYNNCREEVQVLNSVIAITNEKVENFNVIIDAKDKQLGLMEIERDTYKRTNDLLRVDLKQITSDYNTLKTSNKNWRNLAIGSTTVVLGGSILILLLK